MNLKERKWYLRGHTKIRDKIHSQSRMLGGVDLKKPKKIGDFENLPDVLKYYRLHFRKMV